jgi:hypothetical protein
MIAWLMDVVVLLFVLYYIAEELGEISLEKWDYFQDGWNILDWTNMGEKEMGFVPRRVEHTGLDEYGCEDLLSLIWAIINLMKWSELIDVGNQALRGIWK